jgi:cyclophilin family peptidyl-prolyl cis-trans isomerase
MVVELLDQEKPVTVSNFLSYVRNGRYKNTILHRCDPGYVLQGGMVGVCSPFIAARFYEGYLVETNPPIVNETHLGPLISNTFGTLAMATEDGNPDSAAASWFFNLASTNATFLDTNNGGYCVFGRVKSGTNLLNRFNTISTAAAYFPATELCCLLGSVPVPYSQTPYPNYPLYSDLFVVEITELTSGLDRFAEADGCFTVPRLNSTSSNDTVMVSAQPDASGIKRRCLFESGLSHDCQRHQLVVAHSHQPAARHESPHRPEHGQDRQSIGDCLPHVLPERANANHAERRTARRRHNRWCVERSTSRG